MTPQLASRLGALILTSLYRESGQGKLLLFETPDIVAAEPWFWPEVGTLILCQGTGPSIPFVTGGPVTPRTSPFDRRTESELANEFDPTRWQWKNVTEIGELGERVVVGRIPTYREFFNGQPPSSYKNELSLEDADEYLRALTTAYNADQLSLTFFSANLPSSTLSLVVPKKVIIFTDPPDVGVGPPKDYGPLVPPLRGDLGGSCWERLSCIGLDIEKREVTAIVEIIQNTGYGGPLCNSRSFESVGFWLSEPSHTELVMNDWPDHPAPNPHSSLYATPCGGSVRFIGSTQFAIADIPRRALRDMDCADSYYQYQPGPLSYSVSVPLSDDDISLILSCNQPPRLPVLHALVAWNKEVTNDNFRGRGVVHGDWMASVVQYPVRQTTVCRHLSSGVERIRLLPAVTRAVPVHVASLPNGDILFFSGSIYRKELSPKNFDRSNSVALFHPTTNTVENLGDPPFDFFCSGHSTLANGNVLILGGSQAREEAHDGNVHWPGLKDATVFDWKSKKFIYGQSVFGEDLVQKMLEGRWYPSTLILGTGDVYVCDGHPTVQSNTHTNFMLEIYNAKGNRIVRSYLNGNISSGSNVKYTGIEPWINYPQPAGKYVGLYPRFFLMPDGDVFSASIIRSLPIDDYKDVLGSPGDANRVNIRIINDGGWPQEGPDRVLQDNSFTFNPNKPWDYKKIYEGRPGTGPLESAGSSAVILPFIVPPGQKNVNVEDTEIMTFTSDAGDPPEGAGFTIHPLRANPTWTRLSRRSAKTHRVHGNMVLLPTGKVMLVGGSNTPGDESTYSHKELDLRWIREVEYFDPVSRLWSVDRVVRLGIPRMYHSTAILLLDGRVLVAGSDEYIRGPLDPILDPPDDSIGYSDQMEILTPDYYQKGPQPVFALNIESATYGERISVYLEGGWTVSEIQNHSMFIRCSSVTHAFGYDQRALKLGQVVLHARSSQFQVCVPINPNLMPPGYYMFFVVSSLGVPSCGKMVRIG